MSKGITVWDKCNKHRINYRTKMSTVQYIRLLRKVTKQCSIFYLAIFHGPRTFFVNVERFLYASGKTA